MFSRRVRKAEGLAALYLFVAREYNGLRKGISQRETMCDV